MQSRKKLDINKQIYGVSKTFYQILSEQIS